MKKVFVSLLIVLLAIVPLAGCDTNLNRKATDSTVVDDGSGVNTSSNAISNNKTTQQQSSWARDFYYK